jgi:hypothetical protein
MADILTRTVLIEKAPIKIVIDNYILQPGDFVSWWYSNYIGYVFSVTNCFNLNIILKLGTKIYDTDPISILSRKYEVSECYVVTGCDSGYEGAIILKRHCKKYHNELSK